MFHSKEVEASFFQNNIVFSLCKTIHVSKIKKYCQGKISFSKLLSGSHLQPTNPANYFAVPKLNVSFVLT